MMKPETLYKKICGMLGEYDTLSGNNFAEKIIKNPAGWEQEWECRWSSEFYASAASILVDCLEKMDTGRKPSTLAAYRRILKVADRPIIKGMFKTKAGYFCCSSRFHTIRLLEDVPSLPHIETPCDFNIDKVLENAKENATELLSLPSLNDLKASIVAKKGLNKKIVYTFENGTCCNSKYLLDIIQGLPQCKAYVKPDAPLYPIYFQNKSGDGILLPVRPL